MNLTQFVAGVSGAQQQPCSPADRPIADVVREARKRTGKQERLSDNDLIAWLEAQEVTSEADFRKLSDSTFSSIKDAPGASLMLLNALQELRGATPVGVVRAEVGCAAEQEEVVASKAQWRHPLVEISIEGQVGTIMMANDGKRNALSVEMCEQMRACLDVCISARVRVVILRAKPGAQVWSAGHDIRDFKREDGSPANSTSSAHFLDPLSSNDAFVLLLKKITSLSVPVIGCIEGTVWGAATDICACCDILVGSPEVTFAITPAKLGLPYNASGMSHFIQVLPLHVVKWMFFSSEPLNAEEALRYGFLNKVVPVEQLTSATEEMARTIALRAPMVVRLLKKQVLTISEAPALTPEVFEELHEMRRQTWSSDDMAEGVMAFFEKRPPRFVDR